MRSGRRWGQLGHTVPYRPGRTMAATRGKHLVVEDECSPSKKRWWLGEAGRGGSEQQSGSGWILKGEWTGFADGLTWKRGVGMVPGLLV